MRDRARHATLIGVGTIAQVVLDGRAGVVTTGAHVDTWTGRPGTSINATGSGSARPTTTTLNGQGALVFDGTDDVMALGAGALSLYNAASFGNVMAVCVDSNPSGGDAQHTVAAFIGPVATRLGLGTRRLSTSGVRAFGRRLDADSLAESASAASVATPVIAEARFDWSGNSVTALNSGLAAASSPFSSGGGSTSATNNSTAELSNISARFPGTIAAVIATNQAWSTPLTSLVRLCLSRSFLIPLAA